MLHRLIVETSTSTLICTTRWLSKVICICDVNIRIYMYIYMYIWQIYHSYSQKSWRVTSPTLRMVDLGIHVYEMNNKILRSVLCLVGFLTQPCLLPCVLNTCILYFVSWGHILLTQSSVDVDPHLKRFEFHLVT